jgi:hypothetical protein
MEGFEVEDVFEDTDPHNITILEELEKVREPPLSKSMIEKSVDKVWSERKASDAKSKTTPNIKTKFEEKEIKIEIKKKKDVDIGMIIENMGKHIITVKDLYDYFKS